MTQAFEHTTTVTLPAAPARTFQALIDPEQLRRWLAPHAEVEAVAGGAYRVWGPSILGAPREPDPRQTITAIEPGARLAFRWPLHGVDTDVTLALSPGDSPDETKLAIAHAVHGELPYRRPRHVIDDLWRMHTGNLGDHLRGRAVELPDLDSRSPEVRVSIEIAAPPAKVFRALTVPELMYRWLWTTLARVDLAAGEISYGWSYEIEGRQVAGGPTRILELVENQRLVTDWPDWRMAPDKPSTTVTWILDPLDGGQRTRVTLIHAGFELAVDASDYPQGWAGFLDGLAKVATES